MTNEPCMRIAKPVRERIYLNHVSYPSMWRMKRATIRLSSFGRAGVSPARADFRRHIYICKVPRRRPRTSSPAVEEDGEKVYVVAEEERQPKGEVSAPQKKRKSRQTVRRKERRYAKGRQMQLTSRRTLFTRANFSESPPLDEGGRAIVSAPPPASFHLRGRRRRPEGKLFPLLHRPTRPNGPSVHPRGETLPPSPPLTRRAPHSAFPFIPGLHPSVLCSSRATAWLKTLSPATLRSFTAMLDLSFFGAVK